MTSTDADAVRATRPDGRNTRATSARQLHGLIRELAMARHQDATVTTDGAVVAVMLPDGAVRGVVVTKTP